ncbi:glycoside hydrolase family 5 protein [Mixia osmundae IAM 14324]|uniref:carbonic anhydrase n=1 Tax=Mixia osmundae (strain CBS 9802 / IAM 14324 / JCM 22182 / KY 12970) TaxID=764103 RepID=G7E6V4_MIXOS|nr:glycoside hydrolase family 5 protein [Mixia osmundae IAM 14324]KEI39054.1 glycoside hydrolase family 5 protein [Mixia osmundae IAM 14324]GAA98564.1 hypothetical protein E5Q_05251 [Mixia osmundae IAM 14324]
MATAVTTTTLLRPRLRKDLRSSSLGSCLGDLFCHAADHGARIAIAPSLVVFFLQLERKMRTAIAAALIVASSIAHAAPQGIAKRQAATTTSLTTAYAPGVGTVTIAAAPTGSDLTASATTTTSAAASASSASFSSAASSAASVASLTTSTLTTITSTLAPGSSVTAQPTSAEPTKASAAAVTVAACAPKYTGNSITITGTGTLPKPTAFVTRSGQTLQLSGKTYRMAGPNIYWLGLDENVQPNPSYPSTARVREAMAIAVAMGANTIRALSLGISFGNSLSVEPTYGTINANAFKAIDYAIYAAGQYGLRVILTLNDDYDYYTGGKYTFLRWLGLSTGNYGNAFFTSSAAITAYRAYIKAFITHKNQYNGLTYAQDPTIIAWETGNEWGAYIGREGYPPLAWTNNIASYIKSLAPKQLVIDGTDGIWNYTTKVSAPGLKSSYIDIASDHLYPLNTGLFNQDLTLVKSNNKNLLIGEFDWTGQNGGATLSSYISGVEATSYVGSMAWSVFGHDDNCCQFVSHSDGYSIYYPNGNTAALEGNVLALSQHWHRLTGQTPPKTLKAVACPQKIVCRSSAQASLRLARRQSSTLEAQAEAHFGINGCSLAVMSHEPKATAVLHEATCNEVPASGSAWSAACFGAVDGMAGVGGQASVAHQLASLPGVGFGEAARDNERAASARPTHKDDQLAEMQFKKPSGGSSLLDKASNLSLGDGTPTEQDNGARGRTTQKHLSDIVSGHFAGTPDPIDNSEPAVEAPATSSFSSLDKLLKNNKAWAEAKTKENPDFFAELSRQQKPKLLWIGCSDSRVPANQIVALDPGEVFVHRNIANVVCHTDPNCLSMGEQVLQYAVDVLKVEHVIVTGHYGCGGVAAAMGNAIFNGVVDGWLRNIKDVYEENADRIEGAWARSQPLEIHGWCYRLSDGRIRDLGVKVDSPKAIDKVYHVATKTEPEH